MSDISDAAKKPFRRIRDDIRRMSDNHIDDGKFQITHYGTQICPMPRMTELKIQGIYCLSINIYFNFSCLF